MKSARSNKMGNWFYSVAILMAVLWGISLFGCRDYTTVHMQLVIALIAALYGRILHKKEYDH